MYSSESKKNATFKSAQELKIKKILLLKLR